MYPIDMRSQQRNDTCNKSLDMDLFLHCSLAPAVFIILVLSFLERRLNRRWIDAKFYLLNGRFGIVIPLDFIGTFSNRCSFGFAIGAIANKVVILFSGDYLPVHLPTWAKAFVFLIGGIEVGLSYYPFFACLSTDFKLIGSILGFLYTLTWFIITSLSIAECPQGKGFGEYDEVIFQWPSLLCLFFLLGRFAHMFVKAIWAQLKLQTEPGEHFPQHIHQAEHVRRLLRKPVGHEQRSCFQQKIYQWDPCFKFPSRMIGTCMLALFCLYIVVIFEFKFAIYMFQMLKMWERKLENLIAASNDSQKYAPLVIQLEESICIVEGVWFFSMVAAILTSITYVFHILVCYRKHMKRLWAGEKSFLPVKYHNPSPSECVAAIARYSGWQIAYILWGYFILHIVLMIFGFIFTYGIVYPIQHNQALKVVKGLVISALTFVVVISLMVLQIRIASKYFLQPKISPEDKKKPLALNNRKAFHNFSYFLFFYNVILGVGACLYRFFCSCILGIWLIARIDRTILQRGYEAYDMGYKTWIGMLYVDHYHNNPVLVTFCHMLLNGRGEQMLQGSPSYHIFTSSAAPRVSNKARTRWQLLYTLLRNPGLITLRKPKEFDFSLDSKMIQASVLTSRIQNEQEGPGQLSCPLLVDIGPSFSESHGVYSETSVPVFPASPCLTPESPAFPL
ncbi:stimulated by retinoic acid gene 6 protein-like [Rhinatrema bivittatum]|uniref:stimulated by retinoic acid gene 6 protein-like n=1 Tax=Rhinatrema bivittatum TaxID=194408 RepID=UPI00112C5A9F|nr:stimulated by retinoic acid gene 6 protein-like [Rhinatrema bivittatum]